MARTWESVAPIIPFKALPNQSSPIGPAVSLGAVPPWFQNERQHAERVFGERAAFAAEACLKSTFHADALGDPLLGPDGKEHANYELSYELIRIANLALWLACPSALHLELAVTAEPERSAGTSSIFGDSLGSIRPLPNYAEASLKTRHLTEANLLASRIQELPQPSSVWTAIRFLWLALIEEAWETRLILLWVAIESLFGRADGKDVKNEVSRRIARFLNTEVREAEGAWYRVWSGYERRSEAVHGCRLEKLTPLEVTSSMIEAEGILLTCLRKILRDQEMISLFSSKDRDNFLNTLTKGFDPRAARRKPVAEPKRRRSGRE